MTACLKKTTLLMVGEVGIINVKKFNKKKPLDTMLEPDWLSRHILLYSSSSL